MRKSVVAGVLVAALVTGGGGVAGAAPVESIAQSGSSDTGSAVIDAAQVAALVGLFGVHLLACNLLGSSVGSCRPILG